MSGHNKTPQPDPRDEKIAAIEQMLREVEQQGQRFVLLAASLRRQVNDLAAGKTTPAKEQIRDWSCVDDW